VFIITGSIAVVLGLLLIWGFRPDPGGLDIARILATCIVLAVASALAMSATRLVQGRPSGEDDG
jgi:hypothetical protein